MAAEPTALQFAVQIPFCETLGMRLLRFEDGLSEVGLEVREELCNSWRALHGGAVMAVLDVAMAHATRSPPPPGQEAEKVGVITIEMKTTFMRPGTGRVLARGTRLHMTRGLAFCQGEVFDEAGNLLAHATGTFKFRRPSSNPSTPTQADDAP
jgi:uncharacterized protein (TIGR00369 family)